jgi:hypothetical protein
VAVHSEQPLRPYVAKIAAQAERIGRLEGRAEHLQAERDAAQAELAQTRAQLAEALTPKEPPEPQTSAAPQGEERRRWWQRAWAWLNGPRVPA